MKSAKWCHSILPLTIGISLFSPAAVQAKTSETKQPVTNIFSPPAGALVTPSFVVKGKPQPAQASMLDAPEEPRWDIIKSLPDINQDQTKAINKLQQSTQKELNNLRTQMNEARQELDHMKKSPGTKADTTDTAMLWIYPEGKPFVESVLSFESDESKQPDSTHPVSVTQSIEDTQSEIDELTEKIKQESIKAAGSLKTLLTSAQLDELEMMRNGKLSISAGASGIIDQPAEPVSSSKKRKHDLASTNAGSRVFRSILSASPRGLIWRAERI